MEDKAYAKINLSLDVLGRKDNGYHIISTVFASVDLCDTITISKRNDSSIVITSDRDSVPLDETNLVYKASHYMIQEYSLGCGLNIDIKKRIPIGAGLAGGSSDCATTIKLINRMFDLNIDSQELASIGSKFGADVAYCILGGVMLGSDLGQKLVRISSMPQCYILIAKPRVSLSTKKIYEQLRADVINDRELTKIISNTSDIHNELNPMAELIKALEEQSIIRLSKVIYNKLEDVSIKIAPKIQDIKDKMIKLGALNSLMSGSGSSVFGIYADLDVALQAQKQLANDNEIESVFVTNPV